MCSLDFLDIEHVFLNSLWAFILILGALNVFLWLAFTISNTGKWLSSYMELLASDHWAPSSAKLSPWQQSIGDLST